MDHRNGKKRAFRKSREQLVKFSLFPLLAMVVGALLASCTSGSAGSTNQGLVTYRLASASGVKVASDGPRLPPGWTLEPAGIQIKTDAQPSGVALSSDGGELFVPTSGQWNEDLDVINTGSYHETSYPAASAFLGALDYQSKNVLVAGGGRNLIYNYPILPNGSLQVPPNSTSLIPPLAKPPGISAPGYPGNMVEGNNGWVYVAGSLPMSQVAIDQQSPLGGPCPKQSTLIPQQSTPVASLAPPSCSVVDAINMSTLDQSQVPAILPIQSSVNLIPVGEDAYSIALDKSTNTLYVSNWADSAVPSRANGQGSVSVIKLSADGGTGSEVQVVPVEQQPMGIALSPDGHHLAVANSRSNSISILTLGASGMVTSTKTVPVGIISQGVGGSQPVAVSYSRSGDKLFVSLFGLNAIEVLTGKGELIPETIDVTANSNTSKVTVPFTMIPTGWMPIASTIGPSAQGTGSRLYVANFQGMGAGPGFYNPASSSVGSSPYTEGSVSAVNVPANIRSDKYSKWTAQMISADDLLPLVDRSAISAQSNACNAVPVQGGPPQTSSLLCSIQNKKVSNKDLHVVVLLRENKTVDSMLGYLHSSLPALNASQADETYGPMITANLANLAKTYGIDDSNWVAGDESETGHETLTGGETTPPTELFIHVDNDFGLRGNRNGDPLSSIDNPTTRLVQVALNKGYSERTYGGDLNPTGSSNNNEVPEAIWGNASSGVFSGTNTDYPDTNRAGIFTKGTTLDLGWDELGNQPPPPDYNTQVGLCGGPGNFCGYPGSASSDYNKYSLASWDASYYQCRKSGESNDKCQTSMPSLSILELPDDHTDVFNDGNNPRMWAPQVMVANNDYATGEMIHSLSKSPFWNNTLVMIVEDDTQFTADHVNALRSYVVTAGGLAKRLGPKGQVSHQVSSFCSVDKTIEDLFRLKSMEVCDTTALPLDSLLVSSVPQNKLPQYSVVSPQIPILLPAPTIGSVTMEPWCATGSPTGIGFEGLLHNASKECLGSEVGGLAASINVNHLP